MRTPTLSPAPEIQATRSTLLSSPEAWEGLLRDQQLLEDDAVAAGAARFRERLTQAQQHGREATMGAAFTLLKKAIDPVEKGFEALIEGSTKRRGPKHVALKWVMAVGAETAAYLTAKAVIDHIHTGYTLRKLSCHLADLLTDELKYRRFRELAPGLFKYRMNSFTTSSIVHMSRSLSATMRMAKCDECREAEREECPHLDCSDLKLLPRDKVLIGSKMISVLIETTGLVELVEKVHKRGAPGTVRSMAWIVPTEATAEWLRKRNDVLEDLAPPNLPMIVPPIRWEPGVRGGYRFALRGKHPLVRGGGENWEAGLKEHSMPLVYEALNRIQETAWKVNRRVLDVVAELARRGGDRAGLPATEDAPLPEKPHDIETNQAARREWRRSAHRIKEANISRMSRARSLYRVLSAATTVEDRPAVWFAYNLDFRGRIYPITDALSPQGDDLQKSLLTFAEGKPLGEDGAAWLALHGASTLGEWDGQKMSRLTIQERVDVIQGLTVEIAAVAEDPFVNSWWMEVDEPLQFLAFCFEWAGFYRMWQQGRGEEYVCSLPVAMDGSCNGLQHFSAMFLDEVGAASVNVSPSERPADVYQRIADVALRQVEQDAPTNDLARLWLTSGLINRSLAKRPTMTFGYGSRRFGFRIQLSTYLNGLGAKVKDHFVLPGDNGYPVEADWQACGYLAGVFWSALREVVVKAAEGMEAFQKAARVVAKAGKALSWTVPVTGFPVVQGYFVMDTKKVETVIAGRVCRPSVYTATKEIAPKRQANAIAPNVVHSLDAAALMMTVVSCARHNDGMQFAMVHDSYGTLPADAGLLAHTLRSEFVNLYSRDVPGELWGQWADLTRDVDDAELPEIPAKGKLDLSGVRNSDFFFC